MKTRPDFIDTLAIIGLLTLLLVGLFTLTDYGISTDEPPNYQVGLDALAAISGPVGYATYMQHGGPVGHHGSFYFMIFASGGKLLSSVIPQWHIADGRHFINFLTFLLGVVGFFHLSRRLLEKTHALLATAFFATQPLLWGHAFINQKDMPFMVFFLLSILAGIVVVEAIDSAKASLSADEGATTRSFASDWKSLHLRRRGLLVGAFLLIAIFSLDFLTLQLGLDWSLGYLQQVYSGEAWRPIVQAFRGVAEDWARAPFEAYALRLSWAYWRLGGLALLTSVLIALVISRKQFPNLFGSGSVQGRRLQRKVLVAGIFLGITVSIRPIGIFVGLLVGFYWLFEHRFEFPGLFGLYWITAGFATYFTWPYLWDAPVQRMVDSLFFSTGFEQATMYFGEILMSSELPWHYFPALATIRLTELAIPLFLLGLGYTLWRTFANKKNSTFIMTLLLWLIVPLLALIALKITVYGNIRHLLFMLVPVLLLAGLGIQEISHRLGRWKLAQAAFLTLLLLPNIWGILRLHPYQYAYFNAYIGGVQGASSQFTLDRWCTSYREAMRYVNETAKSNALIAALQAPQAARPFARQDLRISEEVARPPRRADYLLTCMFYLEVYRHHPDWELIHTVSLGDVPIAQVFKREK